MFNKIPLVLVGDEHQKVKFRLVSKIEDVASELFGKKQKQHT